LKKREKTRLEIFKEGFKLYGKDFYLASGDIHYFRIHPNDWEERLALAKDFGLTAIQTYVPWHLCQPEPEFFDFFGKVGELNLKDFLEKAEKLDLKVLLRPAPYICSECDMGGLPSWLIRKKDIDMRCCDEEYLKAVKTYYKRLCKEFVPYLSTNGGPVIAIALDNEYGGYGDDEQYLLELKNILEDNGVDVPFYTTDGSNSMMLVNGALEGCMVGVNYRSTPSQSEAAINLLEKLFPDNPKFVGEFWSGRSIMWGEEYFNRDPKEIALAYKTALNKGAFVNFYMFAGGTNFGFTSGSVNGFSFSPNPNKSYPRHLCYATSYDCDALIGEDGNPTVKYFLCRDVLDEYLGKPKRKHIISKRKTQELHIHFDSVAGLFDNLDRLSVKNVESLSPLTMEEMGQNFGYIYYSTTLRGFDSKMRLDFSKSVRDRATIYYGREYKGTFLFGDDNENIEVVAPSNGEKLELLVENMGRYCNTYNYCDHKGMVSPAISNVDMKNKFYWTQKSLPLNNLECIEYEDISQKDKFLNMPVFLKAKFNATPGIDTFIHTKGFTHGNVWINGFNLGRYWDIGPQQTLYIPGSLLKEENNVIEIFDTQYKGTDSICCVSEHRLISQK